MVSSTAKGPGGSLAGFVPATIAALHWNEKTGSVAIKACLEGIGYLAGMSRSLSTGDKTHEFAVTSRRARQRARTKTFEVPKQLDHKAE